MGSKATPRTAAAVDYFGKESMIGQWLSATPRVKKNTKTLESLGIRYRLNSMAGTCTLSFQGTQEREQESILRVLRQQPYVINKEAIRVEKRREPFIVQFKVAELSLQTSVIILDKLLVVLIKERRKVSNPSMLLEVPSADELSPKKGAPSAPPMFPRLAQKDRARSDSAASPPTIFPRLGGYDSPSMRSDPSESDSSSEGPVSVPPIRLDRLRKSAEADEREGVASDSDESLESGYTADSESESEVMRGAVSGRVSVPPLKLPSLLRGDAETGEIMGDDEIAEIGKMDEENRHRQTENMKLESELKKLEKYFRSLSNKVKVGGHTITENAELMEKLKIVRILEHRLEKSITTRIRHSKSEREKEFLRELSSSLDSLAFSTERVREGVGKSLSPQLDELVFAKKDVSKPKDRKTKHEALVPVDSKVRRKAKPVSVKMT